MDTIDTTTGEVMFAPNKMPPAIAAAIVAVGKQVKQLGADDRNEHGKYAFVSVDKFYERIGKLMADAGLALLIDETNTEVKEGKSGNPWLFANYELVFMHDSGATACPLRRSIALPINGPQTYGAAQSYIEKQFLRQVFKVPTGERDADETAQGTDAPGRTQAPQSGRTFPQRQQAAPASEAKAEATKRWKELRDEIDTAMTVPDMQAIEGSLAWQACYRLIDEAEGPTAAEGAMQTLGDRIERRREMLLGNGAYNDR